MRRQARGSRLETRAVRLFAEIASGLPPLAMTTKANAVPKRLRFGMAEPASHAPANDNFFPSSFVYS